MRKNVDINMKNSDNWNEDKKNRANMKYSDEVKKIINLFTKRTQSLGTQFLMLMNIVIFVTVFFMSFYYMLVSYRLSEISQTQEDFSNQAISNIVFQTARTDIKENNFDRLDKISKTLIQNNLMKYSLIFDKNNNKIIWSTDSTYEGQLYSGSSIRSINLKINRGGGNTNRARYLMGDTGNYRIIFGYDSSPVLIPYIQSSMENNKILALSFLFIGFVFAILMGRLVTVPIKKLADGANILSQGNLKHKIPQMQYNELNILVNAFNEMAQKLDSLYTSLEDKVKERTEEVVEKNNELQSAYKELKEAQSMMVHSEKMRSLGELVAGITHEINNPVNFIYGNLIHLSNYSRDLINIIDKYQELDSKLPEQERLLIKGLKEELEYDFIKGDLPDLIKSCKEGTERTKNIILDLKSFSRVDEMIVNSIDIHKELNTSLNILYNKYKGKINIHKEFSELPMIDCYGGQINQVFLNVIDNAIFAIEKEGDIYIRTKTDDKYVIVEVEDTGKGIPKENIKRIFEPFFTTKTVGEGTGLGMAISYKVIENHHGEIKVESEVGKGTRFIIKLPKEGLKKAAISKG